MQRLKEVKQLVQGHTASKMTELGWTPRSAWERPSTDTVPTCQHGQVHGPCQQSTLSFDLLQSKPWLIRALRKWKTSNNWTILFIKKTTLLWILIFENYPKLWAHFPALESINKLSFKKQRYYILKYLYFFKESRKKKEKFRTDVSDLRFCL